MNIEEILNLMDEMMDEAWSVPLSNGKSMVDVGQMRDLIDDIRLNLPMEIKHAKAIVADRADIVENANREAEAIIKKAEDRARLLISEDEIKKGAEEKAREIMDSTQTQCRQMRRATAEYMDKVMTSAEKTLTESLTEIRGARQEFKGKNKR